MGGERRPRGLQNLGLILGTDVGAEFRAPTEARNGRPVAVTVDIVDFNNRRVATLVSNITITGQLPTITSSVASTPTNIGIATLVDNDVTDKVDFCDMELKDDGTIAFTDIRNFSSTSNRPAAEANTICATPWMALHRRYAESAGGNTDVDSVLVSMGGTQSLAASTYYVPVEGACTGSLWYSGQTGLGVGALQVAPAMLDHVGADVVVLGARSRR